MLMLLLASPGLVAAGELRVGFAEKDITPAVDASKPAVWLAGYGYGRKATGVHDPLMARAVVLTDGREKIALASVDLVGLQYAATQQVREGLEGYRHITVASTHNHEGPDVIGIWGPTPFQRGVSDKYVKSVIDQVVAAIREAEKNATDVSLSMGSRRMKHCWTTTVSRWRRTVCCVCSNSPAPKNTWLAWSCNGTATPRRWAPRTRW